MMGQAHTVLDTEYSRECPVPHLVFVISTVTENNTGSTPPRTVRGGSGLGLLYSASLVFADDAR